MELGRRLLPEKAQCRKKRAVRCINGQRGGTGLLGELFTRRIDGQGQVSMNRRGQAQRGLQGDLPGGRIQQIGPAYDVRDALFGVIDHHRQLVSKQAIRPAKEEITHVPFKLLGMKSAKKVFKANRAFIDTQPPGSGLSASGQTVSASARVKRRAIASQSSRLCPRQLATGTGAGKDRSLFAQSVQCAFINRIAVALPKHVAIPFKTIGFEQMEQCRIRPGRAAGPVDIFDTN